MKIYSLVRVQNLCLLSEPIRKGKSAQIRKDAGEAVLWEPINCDCRDIVASDLWFRAAEKVVRDELIKKYRDIG